MPSIESPALARTAGEAFVMITGADLEEEQLCQDTPPEIDDLEDVDVETESADDERVLPWPSPSKVAMWWRRNGDRFAADTRHLAGLALGRETASQVLAIGTQTHRAAAAVEIVLRDDDGVLFEVRAPSALQRRLLNGTQRAASEGRA